MSAPHAPTDPAATPTPTAAEVEAVRRRRERRFEIISTFILSCAALFTAWSGYQASLWDGIQSTNYSRASALRVEAAQQESEANQYRLGHLDAFTTWLQAETSGNDQLAAFFAEKFPEPLASAFTAWQALDPFENPDAPPTPLAMPEYALDQDALAAQLNAQASATFAEGEQANNHSDVFTLATVLFASALFFAAVSERFEFVPARVTLLVIGGLALTAGIVVTLSQPMTGGG